MPHNIIFSLVVLKYLAIKWEWFILLR